ncbi:MAG: ORF6N domain-containing protein [Bacteroidetes bacterium]|nr:ORF6N domain-containing protein [Bacteroidota bacterium]
MSFLGGDLKRVNVFGYAVPVSQYLAGLYGVEVKRLKEAVRRNRNRFPTDFMFELTQEESRNLRSQIATSSWGGSRYQLFAFTEQGVAMLSGILNSEKAVNVNIAIMRAFVQMRKFIETKRDLALKIEELQTIDSEHNESIQMIFETIRQLIEKKNEPQEPVGFKISIGNSSVERH